jgi:uncharacterized phage protein (TIGR02218 family)
MRTLDPGFAAHVESGATTLATCWRIARKDGVVLGFTDHDEALSFGGHRLPAGARARRRRGDAEARAADRYGEVVGVLHSAAIAEDDILLGRYDGAEVETWRVNWRDVEQRHLVSRASIGEIVREDGAFRAELRSAQHALNRPRGRLYQALCDAEPGRRALRGGPRGSGLSREASVVDVRDRFRLAVDGLGTFEEGWFGLRQCDVGGGKRAGIADQIVSHTRVGGVDISASLRGGGLGGGGRCVRARAGCDRRFATCREKFGNAVNFRGFPHIPGNDFVLRYPRPGDSLDGRALVG